MRTEWRVALLCCLLALAAPAAAQRRALTLDDLHRIHELTEPAFAPPGLRLP